MYVIKEERVARIPAVNVNRIVVTAGAVSIAYLFAPAWVVLAGTRAARMKRR